MLLLRQIVTSLAIYSFFLSVQTQASVPKAFHVPLNTILIDGNLNESCWTHPDLQFSRVYEHVDGEHLTDTNDCSFKFATLWDDSGFCFAARRKDNIHHAPNATNKETAFLAWKDDCIELFLDHDFGDYHGDASLPYFGNYGWSTFLSLGSIRNQFFTYRRESTRHTVDSAQLAKNGLRVKVFSADGLNFACEAHFKWSGLFMNHIPTPTPGKNLAINNQAIWSSEVTAGNVEVIDFCPYLDVSGNPVTVLEDGFTIVATATSYSANPNPANPDVPYALAWCWTDNRAFVTENPCPQMQKTDAAVSPFEAVPPFAK